MTPAKGFLQGPLGKIFRHHIRSLVIFFLPCLLLLLVVFSVRNGLDRRMVLERESATAEKSAQQMNTAMEQLASSVQLLTYNSQILDLCQAGQFTLTDRWIKRISAIQEQLTYTRLQNPCVSTITVHALDIRYYVFRSTAYSEKETAANAMEEGCIRALEASDAPMGWYVRENECFFYAPIRLHQRLAGSVLARVNQSSLEAAMTAALPDHVHRMMLVDGQGTVLADSSGQHMGQHTALPLAADPRQGIALIRDGDTPTTLQTYPCAITGGWMLILAPQQQLTAQYNSSLLFVLLLAALVLVVLVVLIYLSAVMLLRPYETILQLLSEPALLSNEEYDRRYRTMDDLGMISMLIHQKNYQYLAARDELAEKEHMLREAQNAMLLAQMNPHFLFNTLDSIHWMALGMLPEDNRISATICKLSQLLRISLRSTTPQTTVRQEVQHARLYLEIQQLRQEFPIEVAWDVAEELEDCAILCLSLQPLLENAMLHGIRNSRGGRIEVSMREADGLLTVSVMDNGSGIAPEELAAIRERLANPLPPADRQIGLANISCRLKLIYGDRSALTVESQQGQFTRVVMRLPAERPAP